MIAVSQFLLTVILTFVPERMECLLLVSTMHAVMLYHGILCCSTSYTEFIPKSHPDIEVTLQRHARIECLAGFELVFGLNGHFRGKKREVYGFSRIFIKIGLIVCHVNWEQNTIAIANQLVANF